MKFDKDFLLQFLSNKEILKGFLEANEESKDKLLDLSKEGAISRYNEDSRSEVKMTEISITLNSEELNKIINGEQNVILRKESSLERGIKTPFKVFLYDMGKDLGKHVAEFVCDELTTVFYTDITTKEESQEGYLIPSDWKLGMSDYELYNWANEDILVGLHISEFKICK